MVTFKDTSKCKLWTQLAFYKLIHIVLLLIRDAQHKLVKGADFPYNTLLHLLNAGNFDGILFEFSGKMLSTVQNRTTPAKFLRKGENSD